MGRCSGTRKGRGCAAVVEWYRGLRESGSPAEGPHPCRRFPKCSHPPVLLYPCSPLVVACPPADIGLHVDRREGTSRHCRPALQPGSRIFLVREVGLGDLHRGCRDTGNARLAWPAWPWMGVVGCPICPLSSCANADHSSERTGMGRLTAGGLETLPVMQQRRLPCAPSVRWEVTYWVDTHPTSLHQLCSAEGTEYVPVS